MMSETVPDCMSGKVYSCIDKETVCFLQGSHPLRDPQHTHLPNFKEVCDLRIIFHTLCGQHVYH